MPTWLDNITFSRTFRCESFEINDKFKCENKWLVYLTTCKIRNKQYNGETTDSFRFFAYIIALD